MHHVEVWSYEQIKTGLNSSWGEGEQTLHSHFTVWTNPEQRGPLQCHALIRFTELNVWRSEELSAWPLRQRGLVSCGCPIMCFKDFAFLAFGSLLLGALPFQLPAFSALMMALTCIVMLMMIIVCRSVLLFSAACNSINTTSQDKIQ